MADTLKMLLYNSTGLASARCDFICDIIDNYDPCILLLEETWLINSKLNIFNNIDKTISLMGLLQCRTMNY